jgi:Ni/Fe-hydrogenase subunit HybB-like protein
MTWEFDWDFDRNYYPEGTSRSAVPKFLLVLFVGLALMLFGLVGAFLCFWKGLNQTGMNDYFPFGLWIAMDLAIIALGAGAFFTGFLTYFVHRKETKDFSASAVVIGFICYAGAIAMLGVDIGQPLRGWFIFWHANVHSMLTEVSFCITTYLAVLAIEFLPSILENRVLSRDRVIKTLAHSFHEYMFLFAGIGIFLSFFHQGSLGGMFGVLFGRPFAFREGFGIWPWTFFLFIWSSIAAGPCFTNLIIAANEKISGRRLVPDSGKIFYGKLCGWIYFTYMIAKSVDTLYWAYVTLPRLGLSVSDLYAQGPYGTWLLWLELGAFGWLPAIALLWPKVRQNGKLLMTMMGLVALGCVFNRFVFTVQAMAIPVLPFEKFETYMFTWQELSIGLAVVGFGVVVYGLAYRYLPLFPKERALNPAQARA